MVARDSRFSNPTNEHKLAANHDRRPLLNAFHEFGSNMLDENAEMEKWKLILNFRVVFTGIVIPARAFIKL